MKNVVWILSLVMGCLMITAGLAQAWPNDPNACSDCHPQDANVRVIASQTGCMPDGSAIIGITVSNTYPGVEGWAVFDPVVNIKNGYQLYGSFTTTGVPPNHTYTIYGVSGYGTYQSASMGGSNVVYVVPTCPPTNCIDNDNDGYSTTSGCGYYDCNDANASIHPQATEIVRDGIDQDCNGYDLTIIVTKASYTAKSTKLTVQASSLFGASAYLTVDNFGSMSYTKKTGIWSLTVSTSPKPATVTVRGFEGAVVVPVQ